jgi:anti-sigma factor RsiW
MKHLSIGQLECYALGELSIREQQRVENHVTRCPECLDLLYDSGSVGEGNAANEQDDEKVFANPQRISAAKANERMNGPG